MNRFKLGKLPVVQSDVDRALRFSDYAPVTLPVIPGSFDNLSNVFASLGIGNVATLFPLDGNGPDPTVPTTDGYGDCVEAMKSHAATIYAGLVGNKNVPASADVVKQYLKETGGKDSGLNISSSLDDWMSRGYFGEKPVAKVYIDPSNWDHMRLAIFMFGGLCAGIQCTDAMQTQFNTAGTGVWDGSGNDVGGHGIYLPSYTYDGSVRVLTWGGSVKALPAAIALMDECWALVSAAQMANPTRFSNLGFNAQQFLADAQAIADQE